MPAASLYLALPVHKYSFSFLSSSAKNGAKKIPLRGIEYLNYSRGGVFFVYIKYSTHAGF
jgi:hypothetical protein